MNTPLTDTIPGRLYARLEESPGERALAFYSPRTEFGWTDFAGVFAAAAGTGARLEYEGVRPGDVVVIVFPSGEPAARLVLGTLLLGAKPLLIAPPSIVGGNSDLPRLLQVTARKTSARLVVAAESVKTGESGRLASVRTRVVFDDLGLQGEADPEAIRRANPQPDDVSALQLTSGTTGLPRICAWRQSAVIAAIDGMAAAMETGPGDVFLNWTPLYHDMGLVNNFLTCMVTGVPLVMISPFEFVKAPAVWLQALHKTGANVTWSPNFGFALAVQRIQDREIEGVRLDHVRGFWNAAERIHLETMERFHQRFSPFGVAASALKANFGCAENIGGATFTEPGQAFRYEHVDGKRLAQARHAGVVSRGTPGSVSIVSAGKPHPGIKLHVVGRGGEPLPEGKVGELALDSPSTMIGYLGDAIGTSRALRNGMLFTGDLGYLRDGEFYWVGRKRERITIRGKKFDPSDFERMLFDIAGLRQGCFVAFGVRDAVNGTERLVLVSEVTEPSLTPVTEIRAEIRDACLEQHGLTAEVLLVPPGTLAKTSSGKRRHRFFRQIYETGELQRLAIGQ